MSSFTTPAILELLDDHKFKVIAPFEFYCGDETDPAHIFRVPAGFITDLASVPRALWVFLPPHGRYAKAAILHDWLLTQKTLPRQTIDEIFHEAMGVLHVPAWKAGLMFRAVRLWSRWSLWRDRQEWSS